MTRRTVPEEPPDFLTVDEVAAVMRISRNRAYELVRRGVATDGREGIPAERVDKQFRISRYVIEERLGGPITWPIPGFHDIPNTRTSDPVAEPLATQISPKPENSPAKSTRRIRSNSLDVVPGNQLRLFPPVGRRAPTPPHPTSGPFKDRRVHKRHWELSGDYPSGV